MAEEVWIEKSEGERVRIGISEFNEKRYLDARIHYEADDGTWRPTKKGFTLPLELIGEFKEAVEQLSEE